jgi:hypothetical protein
VSERYVLWGTAKGAEDWQETVLLSNASAAQVTTIRERAAKDGFRNIRAVLLTNNAPDFGATVEV